MFAARTFTLRAPAFRVLAPFRSVSTLEGHSHIVRHIQPTNPELSIGVTSKLPPTTDSFQENPKFLETLQEVISQYGYQDPDAISQAQVMVSTAGANLSSGGVLLTGARARRRQRSADSSGGASGQGGAGPEDIFGSLEVDSDGSFVGENGNYQPSGTYRIITRDGILGLSPFLREKLVQRLREQENK
ncbi:hypothetical protein ATERTT37_006029 [Aspergillus terreus]